jgi:GNAT superfamily N-acetyltransferase
MIYLKKVLLDDLVSIRLDHLKSLPVFQDYFMENYVGNSDCYGLYSKKKLVGFITISLDNILTSLYISDNSYHQLTNQFGNLLCQLGIKTIYCQSFDHLLMSLCMQYKFHWNVLGCLYRDWIQLDKWPEIEISGRYAEDVDLPFLMGQDDEVFDPKEMLCKALQKKEIIMFFLGCEIVGCGFMTRIHDNFNYFDLGVWVHPEFRKRGYATQIMIWLKESCLKNNRIPSCGCGIDNIASQHTLAKAGFITKYHLLEFLVPESSSSSEKPLEHNR